MTFDKQMFSANDVASISRIGTQYNLKLILLHGSHANGTAKPDSDVDIAILGREQISPDEFARIYHDFSDMFYESHDADLDFHTLHRADPLFCYQVAKSCRLLYGSLQDYDAFLSYAFSNYFDSKDLFRLEKTLVKKFQAYLDQKYPTQKLSER